MIIEQLTNKYFKYKDLKNFTILVNGTDNNICIHFDHKNKIINFINEE